MTCSTLLHTINNEENYKNSYSSAPIFQFVPKMFKISKFVKVF